ncbi:hypothetical protein BX661DRAFT_169962 [Kickxella alabastrina]|uniref:uncharacterized protein n=1 Tax=Kickxella alabastrina TaxID=61397 RepID=UPI00222043FC|nr:uncharacterized protein BX661DRAFT_169962 [Kickxella alabastrina]KAI7832149.1 hypothetical protein BX661DRAFT_169962 [Kickxella alabastrina]
MSSKQLSARDLLRKSREQKKQQQQKQNQIPTKRQRTSDEDEAKAAFGVLKLNISSTKDTKDTHKTKHIAIEDSNKRQKTDNHNLALVNYGDSNSSESESGRESDSEINRASDGESPDNNGVGGLPAGFFDSGVDPSKAESDDEMKVEIEDGRPIQAPKKETTSASGDGLERELAAFEDEVLQLEVSNGVKDKANESGESDELVDDIMAESYVDRQGEIWETRTKRLLELHSRIKAELQNEQNEQNDQPPPSSSSSSDADSDLEDEILNWRNTGFN